MPSFWNNVNPSSVSFNVHSASPYTSPPLNKPLPNNILPPGVAPQLPPSAVPAHTHDLKALINHLPPIFTVLSGNSGS